MKLTVRFEGIDDMGRAVFKTDQGERYGVLDLYFFPCDGEKEVLDNVIAGDLVWFGSSFNCEPMGGEPSRELVIERKGDDCETE